MNIWRKTEKNRKNNLGPLQSLKGIQHLNMAIPAVFVTGGNGGVGAAICKQLVLDHGCRVFLGCRSVERGKNAIKEMGLGEKEGNISVVQCDVQSDDSVKDAAAKVGQVLNMLLIFYGFSYLGEECIGRSEAVWTCQQCRNRNRTWSN